MISISLLIHFNITTDRSKSIWPAVQSVTPVGSVHKSRGANVGAVEEMMCVVYASVTKGA